jgi:hypothetical protein
MTTRIDIVEIETQEVVESLDVKGYSERQVGQVMSGLVHQMATDRFMAVEVE